MSKVYAAIIGAGKGGSTVYQVLQQYTEQVEIIGMADINTNAPGMKAARKDSVFTTTNWLQLLKLEKLNVIIEATGKPDIRRMLYDQKPSGISIIDGEATELFIVLLNDKKELVQTKHLKGELSAILNSVHEAIEVVDRHGIIKYVNPAFTKMTGIPEVVRVGQNIFEVSPQGALAEALISQKNVKAHRTKVGGSEVEVISNAAPIVVDGEIQGAVVVFQPMNDIIKLMDELKKSNNIIESLYAQIGQITGSKYSFDDLIGSSKSFKATVEMAKRAARSNSTVLISGESGTGKEIYAHAIHHMSNRCNKPFIKVNCAAIPESLLESEFFGHEKGSFTGAVRTKVGKLELANGGTLFLDEIGDMSLFLQAKLLRVLQDMEFERVGGNQTIKVDVRIIAATNRNLKSLIRKGSFRDDLYYRLNVVELNIPPLRQRKEDIPHLVKHLLTKFNRKLGKNVVKMTDDALQLLINYDWPGNVRELENVIERSMVASDGEVLTQKHVSHYLGLLEGGMNSQYLDVMPLEKMEQMLLMAALAKYGNSLDGKKRAAQALNISLATLYNKLKKYKANLG